MLDFYYEGGDISGTQNMMVVHLFSDSIATGMGTGMGFNASIRYKIIDHQDCKNWLEINPSNRLGKLVSPRYPNFYNKSGASCSWVLFIPQSNIDSIIMKFVSINVRISLLHWTWFLHQGEPKNILGVKKMGIKNDRYLLKKRACLIIV